MKTCVHLWWYLAAFFLEFEMFQGKKNCRENPNTILCSVTIPFFFLNRSVFKIMWKNMIEPDRPQMTI